MRCDAIVGSKASAQGGQMRLPPFKFQSTSGLAGMPKKSQPHLRRDRCKGLRLLFSMLRRVPQLWGPSAGSLLQGDAASCARCPSVRRRPWTSAGVSLLADAAGDEAEGAAEDASPGSCNEQATARRRRRQAASGTWLPDHPHDTTFLLAQVSNEMAADRT